MKFEYIPLMMNIGLFLAYIALFNCHCKINKLKNNLSLEQLIIYKKIKNKRLLNFLIGIFIAILVILFYYKNSIHQSLFLRINIMILILLLLPIVIYYIIPVKKFFLEYIHKDDEIIKKDWFNVYQCMKYQFSIFFVIGFLISGFILFIFYK
jgi:hypothetical protein